jgi:hypothetical protein
MQTNHKERLKIVASVLLFVLAALVFYKVFLQPFWVSRMRQTSAQPASVGQVQMMPSDNAPLETPTTLSSVAEMVKTTIQEKLAKSTDDRVYVFNTPYDYIYNIKKKTPEQISQEIKDMTAGSECDSGSGYANCSLIKKSHEYEFDYALHQSYAYYLIPASLGAIPYDDVFRGFKVNNFVGEDGQTKDYLMYVFPSGDKKNLDGPLTGPIHVISP